MSGEGVSVAMVRAVVLSNVPEGLSSAVGMRKAGRSWTYIYVLWTAIAILSGLAALLGATFLKDAAPAPMALVNAVAAGALLTMVSDTMLPEAVEGEHGATGFLVVLGLLLAFWISHFG